MHEIVLYQFGMLLYGGIEVAEQHALSLQCLAQRLPEHGTVLQHHSATNGGLWQPQEAPVLVAVLPGAAPAAQRVATAGRRADQAHADPCAATLPQCQSAWRAPDSISMPQPLVAHPGWFLLRGAQGFDRLGTEAFDGSRCYLNGHKTSLADGAFHLQFDQTVHLHGILHRQFFDERFDEAVDDHR